MTEFWIAAVAAAFVGGLAFDRWWLRRAWRRLRKREAQLFEAEKRARRLERLGRRLAG